MKCEVEVTLPIGKLSFVFIAKASSTAKSWWELLVFFATEYFSHT